MLSFFSILLLLVCGIIGFLLWKSTTTNKPQPEGGGVKRPYPQDSLRIENAGPGAVLHLSNIGPDMEEFDVQVIAKHTYRQDGFRWYEFECDKGTEKIWLEMEDDDELELSIGLRKLKLDEVGLSKKELDRMAKTEEGALTFEGTKYYLEESGRAEFCRYGDEQNAEPFAFWDFESDSGDKALGVEKWSDGSCTVTYSEPVRPSQVAVFSVA